jgi:hypothetical protein
MEDAAELVRIRVNVHQGLRRARWLERRVTAGRDVAEPGADHQQKVGFAQAACERRVVPDRQYAGVARGGVVDVVLAPERRCHRQARRLGERLQVVGGLGTPAATADDDERPFRRG